MKNINEQKQNRPNMDQAHAQAEGTAERFYRLSYLREDGATVRESIRARNHHEAIEIAEKRGLDILFSVSRESSRHSSSSDDGGPDLTLPIMVGVFVALIALGAVLWKCGVF